MLLHSCN